MIPVAVFRELYDYNYWARDRQLKACEALAKEQFLKPMGSSFSSIRDTLAHMLAAEWVWLERWRGGSPTRADAEAQGFLKPRFPSVAALRERWQPTERGVREFVAGLTDERLAQPLTYTNIEGERWSYPLWRTVLHVANHQTYHRGQITTMLRQLGATAPGVDFLVAHDVGFRV